MEWILANKPLKGELVIESISMCVISANKNLKEDQTITLLKMSVNNLIVIRPAKSLNNRSCLYPSAGSA